MQGSGLCSAAFMLLHLDMTLKLTLTFPCCLGSMLQSSLYIEDGNGAVVGEVLQRWHLWKRKYDLYLGKRQFAAIEGGFLAWEFALRDANGGVLALIDRNFQGFGKELFTDAGKYVIHFGETSQKVSNKFLDNRQASQLMWQVQLADPVKPEFMISRLEHHGIRSKSYVVFNWYA